MHTPRRPHFAASLLLLALLSVGTMACGQERSIAVRTMNEALSENQTGNTSDAIKMLKQAVNEDVTFADPPYYLGQLYHQKYNQLGDAESSFKRALERAPDNPQFLYRLGTVQAEQGKHDDAIGNLRKAVEKEPTFAKAWFRLGLSQREKGEFEDAVNSFSKSIEHDPRMSFGKGEEGGQAFHAIGDIYILFRFYDKAEEVYKAGLEQNPDTAQLLRGMGLAQVNLKKFSEAQSNLEKSLEIDPSKATAYFSLAKAQQEQKQYKQAVKTLDRFITSADPSRDSARMGAASAMRSELEGQLNK